MNIGESLGIILYACRKSYTISIYMQGREIGESVAVKHCLPMYCSYYRGTIPLTA